MIEVSTEYRFVLQRLSLARKVLDLALCPLDKGDYLVRGRLNYCYKKHLIGFK